MKFLSAGCVKFGAVLLVSISAIAGVALLSGCNGMTPTAVSSDPSDPFGTTGALSGSIHGGQFPIYNSAVNLYAAGTTGYGSGATLLASTTTDTTGHFQFTKLPTGTTGSGASWSCPSANPDPQIYITSTGGNTQGTGVTTTNNAAAVLMAALGPCSTISTSTQVQVNEITTAATVFALAQYMNPGSGPGGAMIGTNGANTSSNTPQGAIGLNNAVAGIVNLASISAGTAVTANTYKGATGSNVSSVTVTATPETSKLVTIANILAACINTTSSSSLACADLFASASPPLSASVTSQPSASFVKAQDTVQAAYYMAVNPTDAGTFTSCNNGATTKMGCLFNLPTAAPPFQTGLVSAPTDWTLSVSYSANNPTGTGTTLGTATGAAVNPYACAGGHYFMYGPEKSAVDAYGNLWFINSIGHTDNVAAISPIGVPLYCATATNPGTPYSAAIAIDTAGNVWAELPTGSAPEIFKISSPGPTPTNLSSAATLPVYSGTSGGTSNSLIADGYGNVFYTTWASASGTSVYEIPSGSTSGSTLVGSDSNLTNTIEFVAGAVDSEGRLFFGANSTGTDSSMEVTPPSAAISGYSVAGGTITFTTATNPTFNAGQSVIVTGLTSADGLILDRQQLTLTAVTPSGFSAVTTLSPTSGSVSDSGLAVVVPTGASSYLIAGIDLGIFNYGEAADNNNYIYTGTTCCGGGVNETLFKVTANPIGAAITSQAGNFSYSAQNIGGNTGIRSVALDGAGNVWFGNEFPSTDGGSTGTNQNANTGIYSVGEVATSGGGSTAAFAALSPAPTGLTNGDTCATASGCPVGGGFQKASLGLTFGLSIDPSGNVWAPNFTAPSSIPVNGYGNANIVEIIGAAVPVVTPLSVGAKNGTLATKP